MVDEIALIEGYRVPWIICIQILVLLLLIVLLLGFSLSSTSDTSAAGPSSSSSSGRLASSSCLDPAGDYKVSASCYYSQVRENRSIRGEMTPSTARRIVVEDNPERDQRAATDTSHVDLHPCNYFKIAKLAFLKCLGLESLHEKSSNLVQKKER